MITGTSQGPGNTMAKTFAPIPAFKELMVQRQTEVLAKESHRKCKIVNV